MVDVYITYLRKKFAAAHPDDNVWTSVIETVRGLGYRIRDRRRIPRIEEPVAETRDQAAGELACLA